MVVSELQRLPLESITVPTLTLSAADDLYRTFEGARFTAEHIPGGRFIGYPSGGHMLVGHSADAASRIAAFLKDSVGSQDSRVRGPCSLNGNDIIAGLRRPAKNT